MKKKKEQEEEQEKQEEEEEEDNDAMTRTGVKEGRKEIGVLYCLKNCKPKCTIPVFGRLRQEDKNGSHCGV